MPYYISPPPQNPVTRILTAIIAVFILAGAFMVGMAALLVVAGVGLIAGIVIWIRVAWIKRKLEKQGVDFGIGNNPPPPSGQIIDAEYTVISEQRDQENE
ncbi:MAG: hypothetical protein GQ538_01080 [Xanthomonadales bacterium]|nr:hypothetical protein [Xanthomonadales bacterium]